MSLNLINGVFYSEHKLEGIDDEALIKEVTNTYLNGDSNIKGDRPHPNEVDVQNTFYEDCPISQAYREQFNKTLMPICDTYFGERSFKLSEIWGHFTKPLDSTMVHDHANDDGVPALSWVYYPHQPEESGNIHFITSANDQRVTYEVDVKAGHLYMFSPSILHYVPRNGSGVNRVSISGNIIGTDQYKNILMDDEEFNNNYWYYVGRNDTPPFV